MSSGGEFSDESDTENGGFNAGFENGGGDANFENRGAHYFDSVVPLSDIDDPFFNSVAGDRNNIMSSLDIFDVFRICLTKSPFNCDHHTYIYVALDSSPRILPSHQTLIASSL